MLHQPVDILRGRVGNVDNKAGVLLRDLCAADAESPQAALVDQCRGVMTLRPLKGTPARGQADRLFLPPPGRKLLHPRGDRCFITRL